MAVETPPNHLHDLTLVLFVYEVTTASFAAGALLARGRLWGYVRGRSFQGGDLGAQGGDLGLQGLEFVATDQVQFGGEAVALGAEGGLGFFTGGLGETRRSGGQLGDLVQEGVLGMHGLIHMGNDS